MIKNITTIGDSFTYGEELADRRDAYAYKLADLCSADVVNLGAPGTGNKSMIRRVIEICAGTSGEDQVPDLIVIGWSSPGRMEFADADGVYDIWPGQDGSRFKVGGQEWRTELMNYINKHHDTKYIYQQYLQDIILTQSLLCQQNIRYVMMTTNSNEYYHKTWFNGMPKLASLIDASNYLGWPTEGMAEWTQGCKRGPMGHFLEEGHKRVAAKLYQHIKNNGWL